MHPKITAYDFAVLTRVNELATRHGLEPWEFDALYDCEMGALSFPSSPTGADKHERFERMTQALGCVDGKVVVEDDAALIRRLDAAIQAAPRARLR